MQSRMVERDAELAILGKLIDRAGVGRGGLMAFDAPAGMGKSRLLWQAREMAAQAGWRTLDARCSPMSPSIGFGVLRDWFGLLAHRAGPGVHPFDGPGQAVAEVVDGGTRPLGDLVYGARWVIEELTAERPLLVTVDDLQWADSGSLQVLDLLAPALEQLPCLFVYAVRSGELSTEPEELARIREVSDVITPAALSASGVAAVIEAQGGDIAQAASIHTATGGVPLFVNEVIAGGGVDIPESLVGSIAGRLSRLSPTALATAHAVAVLGNEASIATVAELNLMAPDAVAHDLGLLTAAQLVTRDGGHLRPRHPLVGEALLAGMTATETADLHRRAAAVLRRHGAARIVVAGHLLLTTPGNDPDVRARLAEQGRHALAAGAPERAHRYLERALAEGPVTANEIPLLSRHAIALTGMGEIDAALASWERASALTDDPDVIASLRSSSGDALLMAGRHNQAQRAFGSLPDAGPATSPGAQRLASRMVFAGILTGMPAAELRQQCDRVLGQPKEPTTSEDRLALAASAAVGVVSCQPSAEVRALAMRASGEGALLDAETVDGTAVFMVACSLAWSSALHEADTLLDTALETARTRGSVLHFANAAACRGLVRARMGLAVEATADLESALEQRGHGWNAGLAMLLANLVECRIARGELDRAIQHRGSLESFAHTRGISGAFASSALADLAEAHGDHETAARLYAEVGRLVAERMDNPAVLPWRAGRALALIRLGEGREAAALAQENLVRAEAFGAAYTTAQALRTVAAVDPTCDRVRMLRRALGHLAGVPAGRLEAQVATDLAGMLILLEGPPSTVEAVALLRRAETWAQGHELRPLAERVQRLLARVGEVPHRTDADALALLTPSERRVANLAATGRSNRQIAQELFVTVKAVEWHLSNVYRKLGIRSRTRLPALLSD
jgi:DNA-binding CsgD family transcriptional regulator/tetratricopeptide (TPR) repeat protein